MWNASQRTLAYNCIFNPHEVADVATTRLAKLPRCRIFNAYQVTNAATCRPNGPFDFPIYIKRASHGLFMERSKSTFQWTRTRTPPRAGGKWRNFLENWNVKMNTRPAKGKIVPWKWNLEQLLRCRTKTTNIGGVQHTRIAYFVSRRCRFMLKLGRQTNSHLKALEVCFLYYLCYFVSRRCRFMLKLGRQTNSHLKALEVLFLDYLCYFGHALNRAVFARFSYCPSWDEAA